MSIKTTIAALACMALAACGGSSHAQTSALPVTAPDALGAKPFALAAATGTTPGDSGKTLSTLYQHVTSSGQVVQAVINGVPNEFSPAVGNAPSGGQGPANSSLDGDPCDRSMSRNYHIHVFMGLYVNGTEYALPRGIGAVVPTDPNAPTILYATQCFYATHTHDSTGIVHVEDYNGGVLEKPPTSTKYTTGQLFAVWGVTVSPNGFGPFSGPVEVFTSGEQYRALSRGAGRIVSETTLQPWTGDPNAIPLYDHQVIWYLVGPSFPATLPNVNFAVGY
jgi:hypothetical protein